MGTLLVMALVRMAGELTDTIWPPAIEVTVNVKVAARNQFTMVPDPPLPVMFSEFKMAVLVRTVVYNGYEMVENERSEVSHTRLTPHDSIELDELPVCAHIPTVTTSPGTAT